MERVTSRLLKNIGTLPQEGRRWGESDGLFRLGLATPLFPSLLLPSRFLKEKDVKLSRGHRTWGLGAAGGCVLQGTPDMGSGGSRGVMFPHLGLLTKGWSSAAFQEIREEKVAMLRVGVVRTEEHFLSDVHSGLAPHGFQDTREAERGALGFVLKTPQVIFSKGQAVPHLPHTSLQLYKLSPRKTPGRNLVWKGESSVGVTL